MERTTDSPAICSSSLCKGYGEYYAPTSKLFPTSLRDENKIPVAVSPLMPGNLPTMRWRKEDSRNPNVFLEVGFAEVL